MRPKNGGGKLRWVQSSEVRPLLAPNWEDCSHHEAQDLLHALGWSRFAQGDWAYAYESPSRQLVARLAPFDPGYRFFVELCSRCQGNPYLSDIHLASKLEGGGHLTVMEHLNQPTQQQSPTSNTAGNVPTKLTTSYGCSVARSRRWTSGASITNAGG
ncbi:hypothetical protein GCM10011575_31070 [Microlunatus endophyticus]|uniref:Uncharacterized protein n=1 Tax=Microlunatus endophyticus TaxID=1716077 RepID=A0A917W6X2_9ACTN|nr:hypothetical protein GCM10011575_31070 [Microlunatus endophyticus]